MRKVCIIFLLSIIISLTALGFSGAFAPTQTVETVGNEYLRIHIRADSNDSAAQAVKYRVRDKIVEYLTPLVAEYPTKAAAMQGISSHIADVSALASEVLRENGFAYSATAELTVENFPTRVYDGCTLPAGEYSALIIKLGSGKGDNWWCVVYPPLCFAATNTSYVYKSKIAEIIADFKARNAS